MAREAAELMAEASAKRRELFERLRDDGTESVPVEGQSDFGEIPSPSAARSLRRAWVRLAAPLLRPEDRLLPTRPEFRPDESEPEFAEDPPGSGLLIWLPAAGAAGGGR
jgi:hypothetical protein